MAICAHIVLMGFTPLLLAVPTLGTIQRIILKLLAVILRAAPTLAKGITADDLVRPIARRGKGFVAIGPDGMSHNLPIA